MEDRKPVQRSIADLADRMGREDFVAVCVDLLAGASRERHVEALRGLTGHRWEPGDAIFDRSKWPDYWVRSWGARGLLHVWDDGATDAVVSGLADESYRPAEACLKVAARHEVAGTGDGAALLTRHELPRVRAQALRCLAATGDSEHVASVRRALSDANDDVRRRAVMTMDALTKRLGL